MATERLPRKQLNVVIDKEARRNLNRIMEHEDIDSQSEAVAFALKLAMNYLLDRKEIDR